MSDYYCFVCTTPDVCLCSSSGEECCCIPAEGAEVCEHCHAPIIVIDFETGQPLSTKGSQGPS